MNGWIIYKRSQHDISAIDHGVNSLLDAAYRHQIKLTVYRADQFEWFMNGTTCHLLLDGYPVDLPQFVIPRTGAETNHYTLALLRQLEWSGVYICNTASAIESVRDKQRLAQTLINNEIPTPKSCLIRPNPSLELIINELGLPLIVEPVSGSKGMGVFLCETDLQFRDVIDLLMSQGYTQPVIAQVFEQFSFGRDVRVFVLGGKVIGCMERQGNNNFKANYSMGGAVLPYLLTPEIESLAIRATQVTGLDVAGVDLLFTQQGFSVCEVNSSPGFKGLQQAIGGDIATDILNFITRKLTERAFNNPSDQLA